MVDLIYKQEVFAIIGVAIEVHNALGAGFLEAVYHEAMEIEARLQGVPVRSRVPLQIEYKGRVLQKHYEADMIAYDKIVVELKALNRLTSLEEAQLLNYLKATGFRVGVLINFGTSPKLEWKRFVA